MKKTGAKITRYESGDYYVDVVELDNVYEAHITRKGYGVTDFMFGAPKEQQSLKKFVEIVEANLDEYKSLYDERHAEED